MWPPRSRTARVLAVVASLAIGAALVWICLPHEPSYNGKRFTYWLDQLPGTLVNSEGSIAVTAPPFAQTSQEAKAALDAIGTNGLRTLIARFRHKDSKIKLTIQRLAVRLGLLKPNSIVAAEIRRGQALTAIIRLDERAAPLVPDLIALLRTDDPSVRLAALHALRNIAPQEYRRIQGQFVEGP
jgi:hypothetical protein